MLRSLFVRGGKVKEGKVFISSENQLGSARHKRRTYHIISFIKKKKKKKKKKQKRKRM